MAKMLIVDDDPQIRKLLGEFLKSLGHEITTASSGLEALGLIHSRRFEIALLDIGLPQISGTGLLDIIKKRYPNMMAIMISGQANLDSAIDALKKGAFDYIKKPLILKDLEKTVALALEEAKLMKGNGYIYKDSCRYDKTLIRNGIIYAATDSMVAGLAFFLGFIIQAYIFSRVQVPLFLGSVELYQMSLGLAFCYAFIFVFRRGQRVDLFNSNRELASHIFRNMAYTYILYLSVLFMIKNISFITFKFAVGAGFICGLIGLVANRILILPFLFSQPHRKNEDIVLVDAGYVGTGSKAHFEAKHKLMLKMPRPKIEAEPNANDISTSRIKILTAPGDLDNLSPRKDFDEVYILRDTFSPNDIVNVMDRFNNQKIKIVVFDSSNKMPCNLKE